jgi:hypothetical protein
MPTLIERGLMVTALMVIATTLGCEGIHPQLSAMAARL